MESWCLAAEFSSMKEFGNGKQRGNDGDTWTGGNVRVPVWASWNFIVD